MLKTIFTIIILAKFLLNIATLSNFALENTDSVKSRMRELLRTHLNLDHQSVGGVWENNQPCGVTEPLAKKKPAHRT